MTDVEKLQVLTGEKDEKLLAVLLDDAKEYVLAYTHRTTLPAALQKTVRDLAVIALNRLGTEGEMARSEAGESHTFAEAPSVIFDVLDRYRLARVGGMYHEKTQK